ncbi:winged helix-turn-helix domain-containing protein [[Clostridium] symbiosum]|uniref:GntR family transcriptional regulator n=1 Tax=Clostridium symbiosum TaxID=1512 RepID=UPI001D06342A|nr:winged helix-turn-helix domain-containing protein [[Clostridium] symbiosum]MCB6608258.1 winged helix-turn-helix domain-containing protein [[Clostridium] symbiosum]MCB6932808.1 winged helix-turn-helix domain-containing protein [[Clostridium] symbiosum]
MEYGETGDEKIPLYRQISDEIRKQIEAGELESGMRLLSEAAMSGQKGVSVGTVKKAYAELEKLGYIYKVRGGGAYVSGKAKEALPESGTPEEIIAEAVRELSQCGLKMNRIFSIIREQSGQVFCSDRRIRAALVDSNPEVMHYVMMELKQFPFLDVTPYQIGGLLSGETVPGADFDLALVSHKYYDEFISYADSIRLRTERISLRESRETIARLAVLPDGQDICVIYRSREFLEEVRYVLKEFGKKNKLLCINEERFTSEDERYIYEKFPLIIPPDYMDYSGPGILQLIVRAQKVGCLLIPFEIKIDKGSLIHLKQTLERIQTREAKFII